MLGGNVQDNSILPSDNEDEEGDDEDEETEDEEEEWDGGSKEGKATKSAASELNPRHGPNTISWTPINGSPASRAEPSLPQV